VPYVRLNRKLAPIFNGVDLSNCHVGDLIVVPDATAVMLIREGWAELVNDDTMAGKQVKVWMARQPTGSFQGLPLHSYHPGQVYDLPASLAEYLVVERFAIVEMRREQKPPPLGLDRRRKIDVVP
jgi:hypothetical protein